MWSSVLTVLIFVSSSYGEPVIIGGSETDLSQYPFQVSIEFFERYICAGTILNEGFVLTTANCLFYVVKENTKVRAGSDTIGSGGILYQVFQGWYHADYDSFTTDYNIGAVQIDEVFAFGDLIQPVSLVEKDYDPPAGTVMTVVGWGARNQSSVRDGRLYRGSTVVMDRAACNSTGLDYQLSGNVTQRMICALDSEPCRADSGGPLLLDGNVQAGIVSVHRDHFCFEEGYPVVYTNLGALRDWIGNLADV